MSKPTLQDKLNIANHTVSMLMKEVDDLQQRLTDADSDKMMYYSRVGELAAENETLKGQKEMFENAHNKGIADYEVLFDSHEKLKSDYALLEEKYYTQSDNYTEVNKMHNDLIDSHNKVTAENYALKAEIERTNRHINLAENQLHKEQQPTVINYHNCTFNQ